MLKLALVLWIIVSFFLFILSLSKIRKGKEEVLEFIYPVGFILGVFVYEDLLVFSLYHIFLSSLALLLSSPTIFLLGFLVFWFVRSVGETLYFFLQQFIRPNFHPHAISSHFHYLRRYLGNISDQKCFIIMQVLLQSVTMTSLLLLILLLLNWQKLYISF